MSFAAHVKYICVLQLRGTVSLSGTSTRRREHCTCFEVHQKKCVVDMCIKLFEVRKETMMYLLYILNFFFFSIFAHVSMLFATFLMFCLLQMLNTIFFINPTRNLYV